MPRDSVRRYGWQFLSLRSHKIALVLLEIETTEYHFPKTRAYELLENAASSRKTAQGGLLRIAESLCRFHKHRDYLAFAYDMAVGDKVLIICHHFPFALVTVDGDYNYVRNPVPEIGVWFRHFRRIRDLQLYSDRVTNANNWQQIKMTDTIARLQDVKSASYELIQSW